MQTAADFYAAEHGQTPFLSQAAVIELLQKYVAHQARQATAQSPFHESWYETDRSEAKKHSVHLGI